MHQFSIVLEDGSDVFFEPDHGRYLLLFETLLKDLAERRGLRCPKDFDGYIEAERAVDSRGEGLSAQEWLAAYGAECERTQPLWFPPAEALDDIEALRQAVEDDAADPEDEDRELLLEALEVLVEALAAAKARGTRFMMAVM